MLLKTPFFLPVLFNDLLYKPYFRIIYMLLLYIHKLENFSNSNKIIDRKNFETWNHGNTLFSHL